MGVRMQPLVRDRQPLGHSPAAALLCTADEVRGLHEDDQEAALHLPGAGAGPQGGGPDPGGHGAGVVGAAAELPPGGHLDADAGAPRGAVQPRDHEAGVPLVAHVHALHLLPGVGAAGADPPPPSSPGMHRKGGEVLQPPPPPFRAPSLCPATVPLTASARLNGICNRQ